MTPEQIRELEKKYDAPTERFNRGDFMQRASGRGRGGSSIAFQRYQKREAKMKASRIANMSPQEKAEYEAWEAQKKKWAARQRENSSKPKLLKGGWGAVASGPLNPIGKDFQQIVLARDWNTLFQYLPLKFWGKRDSLGKYSFTDKNGRRTYHPFSKADIHSFVFSPYYSVQPGYTCSDAQRDLGVAANVKGMVRHGQKFRINDPQVIWPIFPGGGYGGKQTYGCQKAKKSTWVKIRGAVAVAVAIVAAVYIGPAALTFVQNTASVMTGGLIPAAGGGAAGAAGGAAGAAAAGGGSSAVAAATTSQKILSGAKTLVGYVNKARTIKAIAKGEMPPIPIGIGGASFGDWAMIVAKQKLKEEAIDAAMGAGVKYIEKKMTAKEENKIRAEIAELQAAILKATPPEVKKMPPQPMPELAPQIKTIQAVEVKKQDDLEKYIIPGAIVAGALLLGG